MGLNSIQLAELGKRTIECATRSFDEKVAEESPNWGKWVSVYLKFVGIFSPAPWCAAFAAYKVYQAANELGMKASWPKTGRVQSVVNWATKTGHLCTAGPYANTAFVIYYSHLKRYGHIGFIREVQHKHNGIWIRTIEGNSNDNGSREGTKVVMKWRLWKSSVMKCVVIS